MARRRNLTVKDVIAGIALIAVLIGSLLYWFEQSTVLSDAVADWGVARAVLEGEDPYTDVREIVARHGGVLGDAGSTGTDSDVWVHPRTPGALLVLAPLGLMSSTGAHRALLVVSAIAVWVLAAHLVPRLSSLSRSTAMLAAALALASAPLYSSFEFGTISIVVTALIFASWVWADSDRHWIAGVALGLAISLKVWPGLLLIPLLVTRRFEVVRWSLATVLVIQVAGSILFGITPTEVFSALAGTSAKWLSFAGNGSASGTLVRLGIDPWLATIPLLILGAVTVWVVSSRHEAASYPIAIVVGLLVSPLAWEHYDVALLGVAALIVSVPHWPRMLAGAFLVLAMFGMQFRRIGPTDMYVVGWRTLVGRLLMLAAVVLSLHVLDLRRREQPARRAVSLQRASGATSEEHRGKSLSKVP